MKLKPLTVLADDLTGACELAAIGHRAGLQTVISTCLDKDPGDAELVVYDTETRLCSPAHAAQRLRPLAHRLKSTGRDRFLYKKTDSVIRGPIAAEIKVLLEELDYPRCLFIPANPGLGRTVQDGFCRIHGTPLEQTGFAADVHHPAKSSLVTKLLGIEPGLAVHQCGTGAAIPSSGLVAGDAGSEVDLDQWALAIDERTLPAGAASFFAAILRGAGLIPEEDAQVPSFSGKSLLVSGTTDPDQQAVLAGLAGSGIPCVSRTLEQLDPSGSHDWAGEICAALGKNDLCLVCIDNRQPPDPAKAELVRDCIAGTCQSVLDSIAVGHLVAEGGATAASICERMRWQQFQVVHAWAQGIVSLRPLNSPGTSFSLKPGSYSWPDSFLSRLTGGPAN